jgi:hypothetical protein
MYKPFFFVAVVSILLYAFLVYDSQNGFAVKPAEAAQPKPKFEVIVEYKGCDVVRMDIGTTATYKYFLDCTDEIIMGMPYGTSTIKARKEKYD